MQKHIYLTILMVILQSCIPFQFAPNIDNYKLVKGKRFKNGLPEKTTFVFEDPKEALGFLKEIRSTESRDAWLLSEK